jgi:hypothetical protein
MKVCFLTFIALCIMYTTARLLQWITNGIFPL